MSEQGMFNWANEPEQVPDYTHVLGELLRDIPLDVQAGLHETLYVSAWRSGTSHGFRTSAEIVSDAALRMERDIEGMDLKGEPKLAVAGIPTALRGMAEYLGRCARHMESQHPELDMAIDEAGLKWKRYRDPADGGEAPAP